MAEIWITSDTHFGHANIITFCGRPFDSVAEMDEALIERWNEVVKAQDHVWHLGDVTMGRHASDLTILGRLNGHKRLVMGNHDQIPAKHYLKWFEKVQGVHRIDSIILSHFPIHPMSLWGATANVHGHIHHNESPAPLAETGRDGRVVCKPYINVCVEHTHYRPVTLSEVRTMIQHAIETHAMEPH